ncbi:hypothetical protein MMC13_008261 [Lambiella insularis]|nr:hypothetical protein [Lambiella insularis]
MYNSLLVSSSLAIVSILLLYSSYRPAWAQVLAPQTDTFNSNFTISASQLQQAGLSAEQGDNVAVALNFERSNWATGSVNTDDFYSVPSNTSDATAGTLLKLQLDAGTSNFTVPTGTALSRIMFQSKNLNGSLVPASAYILWPYTPYTAQDGKFRVVAWAHGSSGCFGDCAPSHLRTLAYHFFAPFTMALQGYVVVAPDYAGLGVDTDSNGNTVPNEFGSNPSHANDLFYAVQAAQSAFSQLSKYFVVVGHSEGGGAAWGAAQRQVLQPVDGYLGAVAAAPATRVVDIARAEGIFGGFGAICAIPVTMSVFPSSSLSGLLTPAGGARFDLFQQLQGCNSVSEELFLDLILAGDLFQPDWEDGFYAQEYQNLTHVGGQQISGPLLVLQGTADLSVSPNITTQAVDATCQLFPQSQVDYLIFPGVTHSIMWAAQHTYLDWINDRFNGVFGYGQGCHTVTMENAMAALSYQGTQSWFMEFATESYETA